jgi:hypothetical protein
MTGQVIQTFSDITQVDHRLAAATGQGKQQHEENATRTPHV